MKSNDTNSMTNFPLDLKIGDNDTGNHDKNSHPEMEKKKQQKAPFSFLKKGDGISRFDGKPSRARMKSGPPNYNFNKPAPKINVSVMF